MISEHLRDRERRPQHRLAYALLSILKGNKGKQDKAKNDGHNAAARISNLKKLHPNWKNHWEIVKAAYQANSAHQSSTVAPLPPFWPQRLGGQSKNSQQN